MSLNLQNLAQSVVDSNEDAWPSEICQPLVHLWDSPRCNKWRHKDHSVSLHYCTYMKTSNLHTIQLTTSGLQIMDFKSTVQHTVYNAIFSPAHFHHPQTFSVLSCATVTNWLVHVLCVWLADKYNWNLYTVNVTITEIRMQ